MHQLVCIAIGYAPATTGAVSFGAEPLAVGLIGGSGLAHAALAIWYGLRRGDQDLKRLEADKRLADTNDVRDGETALVAVDPEADKKLADTHGPDAP